MTPFEVDADYVWALEVIACRYLGDRDDPPHDDMRTARDIVDRENLDAPMDRLD